MNTQRPLLALGVLPLLLPGPAHAGSEDWGRACLVSIGDLDGDGKNEYAFIGVTSMRLRVASGKSGKVLREIALGVVAPKSK